MTRKDSCVGEWRWAGNVDDILSGMCNCDMDWKLGCSEMLGLGLFVRPFNRYDF